VGNFERGGMEEGSNSVEESLHKAKTGLDKEYKDKDNTITKSFLDWMEKESRWKKGMNKVQAYNDEANEDLTKIIGALLAPVAAVAGATMGAFGGGEDDD